MIAKDSLPDEIVDDAKDVDPHGNAWEQHDRPVEVGQGDDAGVVSAKQLAVDVSPREVVHKLSTVGPDWAIFQSSRWQIF